MFARVTLLEIDTLRVSLDDALATFERDVVPRLRMQPGYRGVYAMTTPDGKALLLTLWATAEEADSDGTNDWYRDVLAEYVTLFKAPPGRGTYEVRLVDQTAVVELTSD